MSTRIKVLLSWLVIGTVSLFGLWRLAFAQTVQTPVPYSFTVQGLSTSCVLPTPTTPPSGTYCFGSDKAMFSANGAAYVQLGGVTSFKGRTGAVVPIASDYPSTGGVSSVNGKTGVVVLNVQ